MAGKKNKVKKLATQPAAAVSDRIGVQSNLMSSLKAIYFSKDEVGLKRGVQRMVELYMKIANFFDNVQHFLAELRLRMDLLVDNKADQPARVRCLQAVVECAVQLMKSGDMTVLDFVVDFCQKLSRVESQVIRQYVCRIAGLIYQAAKLSNDDFGTASILPDCHYRSLFALLRERWIDVDSKLKVLVIRLRFQRETVRCEAIGALSFIQQDAVNVDHEDAVLRSPRDMLIKSLTDSSANCRREAVSRLIITDSSDTQLVLGVAQRDTDVAVKCQAIRAVLAADHFEEISTKTRIDVVEHLMAPTQQSLCKPTADLLVHWVKSVAAAEENDVVDTQCERDAEDTYLIGTLHFLRQLDVMRKEKICEMALATVFRQFADEHRGGLANLVTALVNGSEECVQRNNYRMLLLVSDNSLSEKALLLFHWRVLIELCCAEYAKRDDQKSICMFKLVPTLHAFVEFVNEFVNAYAESQGSPFRDMLRGGRRKLEDTRQFCLIQLLRILPCLEREPVGMSSWKRLLFAILTNTEIRPCQPLTKIVVQSIMSFHFPDENDAEPALHEFCDAINTFMQTEQPLNSSAGHFSPSRGFIIDTTQQGIKSQMDEPTRNRSLLILNAMLRSGYFKTISAELQGLYDSILPDSFGSPVAEIRILTLECLGIFSLLDEEYAKRHICLIGQALLVDLKTVKVICIGVLSDLVLRYGYANVIGWYRRSDDEEEDAEDELDGEKSYDFIDKLIELTTGKCPELSFSATECLCKWALAATADEVAEWRHVVQHILLLLFRDECKENPRQMACLSRFMPLFVGTSRRNQVLLADVFLTTMRTLKEGDLDRELTSLNDINEEAFAAYVTRMTSFYVLQTNAFEREKGSAHSDLANMLLAALSSNVDDYYASIYCKMLSELEMNDALSEDALDQLIFLCTSVYTEAVEDNRNMRVLQQFLKRLAAFRDNINVSQRAPTRRDANTPLQPNDAVPSTSSTVNTPIKRTHKGVITPRSAAIKGSGTSIATLTSEFSVGRKKTRRAIKCSLLNGAQSEENSGTKMRATPRITRRPVIERAAKKAATYRADETIIEEDEEVEEDDANEEDNFEIDE